MWHVVSRVAPRIALSLLFASVFLTMLAHMARAEPLTPPRYVVAPAPPPEAATPTRVAAARGNMGGGFLEFVFGGGGDAAPARGAYAARPPEEYARPPIDSRYLPQSVAYAGSEPVGTIVIDTPQHFLYLVEGGGTARRYGIGVAAFVAGVWKLFGGRRTRT